MTDTSDTTSLRSTPTPPPAATPSSSATSSMGVAFLGLTHGLGA